MEIHGITKTRHLIDKVYECEEVLDQEIRGLKFDNGTPFELVNNTIKWFFIEQDIAYWNWSVRAMFYAKIAKLDDE